MKVSKSMHSRWQEWRIGEMEKDLLYSHPRWPAEQSFIKQEIEHIRSSREGYFKDAWNYFDWITYFFIMAVITSRVIAVCGVNRGKEVHARIFAVALIFIWLRLMKVMRAFQALGM